MTVHIDMRPISPKLSLIENLHEVCAIAYEHGAEVEQLFLSHFWEWRTFISDVIAGRVPTVVRRGKGDDHQPYVIITSVGGEVRVEGSPSVPDGFIGALGKATVPKSGCCCTVVGPR